MNNLIIGKIKLQKIYINKNENNNDLIYNNQNFEINSNNLKNNYLDDLKKELGLEIKKNSKFIQNDKSNTIIKVRDIPKLDQYENKIKINNKVSKRDIFFKNVNRLLLNNKKFGNLKSKKIQKENNTSYVIYDKLERNINIKYNFRQLDLVRYYDKNYLLLKIDSNIRILQDKFYNEIKYLNLLEFFPNNGYLTCLINNKMDKSNNHFVIENNKEYLNILEDNKNNHNSFFNIINLNPEEIDISRYLANCILFNNISKHNYEIMINILNKNIIHIKNFIFDIYIEKIEEFDNYLICKIMEDNFFIKKKSDNSREHWINSN